MRMFFQIEDKAPCSLCGTNTHLEMTQGFYFYLKAIKANVPADAASPICKKHANMYLLVFGDDDETTA